MEEVTVNEYYVILSFEIEALESTGSCFHLLPFL